MPSDANRGPSMHGGSGWTIKRNFDLQPVEDTFKQLVIEVGLTHEPTILQQLSSEIDVHTATSCQFAPLWSH